MLKINKYYLVCFFISSCVTFGACVPSQKALKDTLPLSSIFEIGISGGEIQAEIARLKDLTEDKTGKAVSIDVYLRLAVLYSGYRNEERDYSSALSALEKYMAVYSRGGNESEINSFHSLLLKIRHLSEDKRHERVISNNSALIQRNSALTKQNKELIENIEAMKETINKLGSIDLKMEQKRKSYK